MNVSSSILFPSQPAFVGSNITLLCNPNDGQNGATITSYQWVKNGVVLTDSEMVTGSTQSTLSIVNVTLNDLQGVYQCSATNVDGLSSVSTNTSLVIASSGTTGRCGCLHGRMGFMGTTDIGHMHQRGVAP